MFIRMCAPLHLDGPVYFGGAGFFAPGYAAQTCDLNSLSRSVSYRCFISSIDLPTGGPDPLKTHAQTEQAQPQNRSCSTHAISRAKGHLRQERIAEADIMALHGRPSQA